MSAEQVAKHPSKDHNKTDKHVHYDLEGEACKAGAKGDLKKLRSLVQKGLDINGKNCDGRTALHMAAAEGLLSVVEFLVERLQADTRVTDRWGGTPLDDAIRHERKDVVAFLKKKGALYGKMSCFVDDAVVLCDAGSLGDTSRISGLVKRKVDINVGDYDKRTALHLAASEGKLSCVKHMIEKLGADQDVKDRWGGTPIDDAIRGGHESIFKYLQGRGAQRGKTATLNCGDAGDLCSAAHSGDVVALKKLVADGADVNAGDYDNRTALHLAASEGLMLVLKFLVDVLYADVNVVDRWGGTPLDDAIRSEHAEAADFLRAHDAKRGRTALFASDGEMLVRAAASGDLSCVDGLLAQGLDVNVPNLDRRTALHVTASKSDLAMVSSLVETYGADIGAEDFSGATPLDEAIRSGNHDVARYLSDRGASRGSAALAAERARCWEFLEAACQGDVSKLNCLHKQGTCANIIDWEQRTALHLAAAHGRLNAAILLIDELGADVNAMDCRGHTAIDAASRAQQEQVVAFLASRGAKSSKALGSQNEPKDVHEPVKGRQVAGHDGSWTLQTLIDRMTCKTQIDGRDNSSGEVPHSREF